MLLSSSLFLFLVGGSSRGRPDPDSAISMDRVRVGIDRLSSSFFNAKYVNETGWRDGRSRRKIEGECRHRHRRREEERLRDEDGVAQGIFNF